MNTEFEGTSGFVQALHDFQAARRNAHLERILARLRGESADLLPYEEVRQRLKLHSHGQKTLQEIPLDAIVGSVGRYTDFTRGFMPKEEVDDHRWARVRSLVEGMEGLSPIDVYQIGDVYFVLDGNHRVSVVRQLGADTIEAYVQKLDTRVPISPDDNLEDVILKAEYLDFLDKTKLDVLRPDSDLRLSEPGRYPDLLEHIDVHRYFMGIDAQKDISYEEAVLDWYDTVYMPVIGSIRRRGILRDFPDRTEADLYLWLMEHRTALEESLHMDIDQDEAILDLAASQSSRPERIAARIGGALKETLTPESLSSGPRPGQWRKEIVEARPEERLFRELLVPVTGSDAGWRALEQALIIARQEGSALSGLHIVQSEQELKAKEARAIRARFYRECRKAGVQARFALVQGEITREISDRAKWSDLVVIGLSHLPEGSWFAKLDYGFRTILRRSARPVMAVTDMISSGKHALLAFDGSPKAREALYIAAYMGSRWGTELTVVTVNDETDAGEKILSHARGYLEARSVEAGYLVEQDPAGEAIVRVAEEKGCDLIVMGSYGASPIVEVVLGSAVDEVLRHSKIPALISR